MATKTRSAHAPGSILSRDLSHRTPMTTAATSTTAYPTGSWWRRVTWTQHGTRARPILARPPTLARMNTPGVRRTRGQCNMFNNVSHRQFSVSGGPTSFNFSPASSTVRMQPAIQVWAGTGATVNQIEPDLGNDGIWFMSYEVTNPTAGVWHYEYALYNMNLDRAIQSFSVPLGAGVNVSNIGFHPPPQHPGFAHDGTQGDAGFSSTPWNVTQDASSITWNTETFATNQNANAIRFGTLYNFRFDADQPPQSANATVGFFKTGSPMMVAIQAPAGTGSPPPTPTPTATA